MLLKKENADLNAKITELAPIVDTYNKYMDTKALYDEVGKMYGMTADRNDGLKNFVEELEQKLPSDTVITAFNSDGATVTLGFRAASKEEAVNIINNMRSFDSIAAISVSAINEAQDEESGMKTETFTITCTYKPVDAVSGNAAGADVSGNTVSGEAAQ